ncbi:hypothetical protein ACQ4PT_070272 [Festuca glaucescens]
MTAGIDATAAGGLAGEMEVEAYRRLFPLAFFERHLRESVRPDARRLSEARATTVALGAVSSAHGSALVRLGDTEAAAVPRKAQTPSPHTERAATLADRENDGGDRRDGGRRARGGDGGRGLPPPLSPRVLRAPPPRVRPTRCPPPRRSPRHHRRARRRLLRSRVRPRPPRRHRHARVDQARGDVAPRGDPRRRICRCGVSHAANLLPACTARTASRGCAGHFQGPGGRPHELWDAKFEGALFDQWEGFMGSIPGRLLFEC